MNNIKRLVSILQEKLEKYCKNLQEEINKEIMKKGKKDENKNEEILDCTEGIEEEMKELPPEN